MIAHDFKWFFTRVQGPGLQWFILVFRILNRFLHGFYVISHDIAWFHMASSNVPFVNVSVGFHLGSVGYQSFIRVFTRFYRIPQCSLEDLPTFP